MPDRPRVLILAHREGLGSIFSSVYLRPAERLRTMGFDIRVAVFSALGEWVRPKLRQRWRDFNHAARHYVPEGITRLPSPPSRWRGLWDDSPIFRAWMAAQPRRLRPHIIHCGSATAACIALDYRQRNPSVRVVYHSWGPEAAELLFSATQGESEVIDPATSARASEAERRQARAMQKADAVISISRAMTDWALEKYEVDRDRIIEVPCFVDVDDFVAGARAREQVRRELGLAGRFVIAYCGSLLGWQLTAATFEILWILRRLCPGHKFLALTTSPSAMRRLLAEQGFPEDEAIICTVPHAQVPRYLSAADLGILGRGLMQGPDIVNAVSSPIKFGEYLACGTPVLMSEGVGDFSDLARREGVGVVLPHHANTALAAQEIEAFLRRTVDEGENVRKRCRDLARSKLDIASHVEVIGDLYQRLSINSKPLTDTKVPE